MEDKSNNSVDLEYREPYNERIGLPTTIIVEFRWERTYTAHTRDKANKGSCIMTWIKGTERLDGFPMIVLVYQYTFLMVVSIVGGESRPIYKSLCIIEGYSEE
jgi:hypothetical protein